MDTPIRIMADSGARVNILRKKDFDGLKEKPQLLKTNVKVYPYMSSKPLNLHGKLRVSVTSDPTWQRAPRDPSLAGKHHKN